MNIQTPPSRSSQAKDDSLALALMLPVWPINMNCYSYSQNTHTFNTDRSRTTQPEFKTLGEKKLYWMSQLSTGTELVRQMIEHKKVLVLALNGPGVGAGASWFQGVSDIFYAAEGAWMQVTFSQLGLVPETGAAISWAQSMGVHRANDWLMFGGKATVEEMKAMGLVNQIFPKEGFHEKVKSYLKEVLADRSGKSMMEMKRMQNKSLRDQRILALFEAWNGLAERFVDGEPAQRMAAKAAELAGESSSFLFSFLSVWFLNDEY